MAAIKTEDGLVRREAIALSYHALLPESAAVVLIILHGLSEHKGRYLQLQADLAEKGYASYACDQRGFGLSTGARTYVRAYTDFLRDLKEMLDFVRERHPGRKVVIVGHSLGGAVSAAFCIEYPDAADGLVLSAPAYDVPTLPFRLEMIGYFLNRVAPRWPVPYRSNPEYLSRDAAVGAAFSKDPLRQQAATPRFYMEFKKMNQRLHRETEKIVLPTLILQGSADRIVIPEGARAFFERLGSKKKKLLWYDGFYHEVFNEIGRERVISDLICWLKENIG